uniref:Uncharacterized protein n=1 Tax=Romanomermis culicivorax TaxID=13658 RepID=A0A915HKD0_ROMCU
MCPYFSFSLWLRVPQVFSMENIPSITYTLYVNGALLIMAINHDNRKFSIYTFIYMPYFGIYDSLVYQIFHLPLSSSPTTIDICHHWCPVSLVTMQRDPQLANSRPVPMVPHHSHHCPSLTQIQLVISPQPQQQPPPYNTTAPLINRSADMEIGDSATSGPPISIQPIAAYTSTSADVVTEGDNHSTMLEALCNAEQGEIDTTVATVDAIATAITTAAATTGASIAATTDATAIVYDDNKVIEVDWPPTSGAGL